MTHWLIPGENNVFWSFFLHRLPPAIDRKQAEEHLRQSQASLELAQPLGKWAVEIGPWSLAEATGRMKCIN
jgi:hypothetical protein